MLVSWHPPSVGTTKRQYGTLASCYLGADGVVYAVVEVGYGKRFQVVRLRDLVSESGK